MSLSKKVTNLKMIFITFKIGFMCNIRAAAIFGLCVLYTTNGNILKLCVKRIEFTNHNSVLEHLSSVTSLTLKFIK